MKENGSTAFIPYGQNIIFLENSSKHVLTDDEINILRYALNSCEDPAHPLNERMQRAVVSLRDLFASID